MSAQKTRLDQLNISSPCTADWAQMSGDARKRHCAACNKFVYDFAQLSRQEVTAIVAARRGSLCARITRRADGSLLTYEPSPNLPLANRRTTPVAAAVMSALLGLSAPGVAQTALPGAAIQLEHDAQRAQSKPRPGELTSSINGVVADPAGAVVANAAIMLINMSTGEERKTRSSGEGEYSFPQVPSGSYRLNFESPGFRKLQITDVALTNAQELRLDANLQVGVIMGEMVARPQPLRTLYQRSELIAIAEVGNTIVGDMSWLKTRLHVSTLLKGTVPKQGVYIHHIEVDAEEREFVRGDRLLVFLNRRRDERDKLLDGYEASDWGFGIKKLDDSALSAYRARIEELAALLQHGQPTQAELVEWLVRCAEDPSTREEGARDLAEIVARLPECEEGADCAPQPNSAAEAETPAAHPVPPLARPDKDAADDPVQLTAAHKQRLADALFRTEVLNEQDLPLVTLVQRWNDARMVPFLVAQLRRIAAEAPPLAESLVAIIVEAMNDEELKLLADDYSANAIYSDESLTTNEEREDMEFAAATAEPDDEEVTTNEEPVDVIAKAQRAARLAKLLSRIERKLTPR